MINEKQNGLPPIINQDTEILIIGTFPSEISRKEKQYYANEDQNDFWQIIRQKYKVSLSSYDDKLDILFKHKIGLWDVLNKCVIDKSKNESIKYDENDYSKIIEIIENPSSKINKIIINGTSKKSGTRHFFNNYIKYIKKELKKEFSKNINIVYLHMLTGQYYRIHKTEIQEEWINELPD